MVRYLVPLSLWSEQSPQRCHFCAHRPLAIIIGDLWSQAPHLSYDRSELVKQVRGAIISSAVLQRWQQYGWRATGQAYPAPAVIRERNRGREIFWASSEDFHYRILRANIIDRLNIWTRHKFLYLQREKRERTFCTPPGWNTGHEKKKPAPSLLPARKLAFYSILGSFVSPHLVSGIHVSCLQRYTSQ